MTVNEKAQAELLKQNEDVKTALKQTATIKSAEPAALQPADRAWFVVYAVFALGLAIVYYLLRANEWPLAPRLAGLLERAALGGIFLVLVFAAARALDTYFCRQIDNHASRYNLNRLLTLLVAGAIGLIVLTVISDAWYTVAVSVGLISIVLGLALQLPITSFIGWIYLLVRQPYRVGDRIKIGEAKGDVIDVGYLDTTLWEFGGPYLSTEHPSGRIIKFPNSLVLNSTIYNYSWPLFPYIWNEIKFEVAYNSDLEFLAETMRGVVEEDLGGAMLERVGVYRQLLAQTPVNELEIQERPVVHFRASGTWLEAIVRYLVHPKESGRVKTRLTKKLLERLNADPDRVKFPFGSLR